MKKILLQLFVLVILVSAGYALLKYYPWQQKEEDVWIPPFKETVELDKGPYVVYQTTRIKDRGTQDWANDDTMETIFYRYPLSGAATPTAFAWIDMPSSFGAVWGEAVGQQVFVHRYDSQEHNALLDLDGTVRPLSDQDQRLASANGKMKAQWSMNYENSGAAISLQVYNNAHQADAPLVDREIDQAELGVDFGYGEPFLVSDDSSTIYLRQVCECDASGLTGLWAFDIASQSLRQITYVSKNQIHEYDINPRTNQLLGVTWTPGDGLGDLPSGPTAIYLVDLKTDTGKLLQKQDDVSIVYGNPVFSSDATAYAYDLYDRIVRVGRVNKPNVNEIATLSGRVYDWVGTQLIIDAAASQEEPMKLEVYDLDSKTTTSLAEANANYHDQDYLNVQYVGVVTIE